MRRFLFRCLPPLMAACAFCQIAIDVRLPVDRTSANSTAASLQFSTASPNELLLAFISTDYVSGTNTTVTGVSGGGLTGLW